MAEFESSFQGMRQAAQDEETAARKLKQMETEVNQIIMASAISFPEAASIRNALRRNLQNVTSARQKLDVMSSTLREVLDLYQSTEKEIADSHADHPVIKDGLRKKAQDVLERIREISEGWGMDRNAEYSKDPVNLCNGNYVYEKVCMELNTEIEMQFRIFYNIQNDRAGSLGQGWIHTWEVMLERTAEMASMIRDDYSRYVFLYEDGEYRAAPGTSASFCSREEQDIVTDQNGISYFFNYAGRLQRVENLAGSYVTLQYDESGVLNRVTDRRGNYLAFTHDADGRLQKVTDSADREVAIVWQHGRLAAILDPQKRKTTYRYDSQGRLTELINGNGISCLVNTYDEQGRTLSQSFPDGGKMRYRYLDDLGQVVLTEQNGNEIIYEHDGYMRNTHVIYSDGEEYSTYDENNNRTSITDKRGNTSYYVYDNKGNLKSFRNALGDEVSFSYTVKRQICEVRLNGELMQRSDYNDRNLQIRTENAAGAVDRYEYDDYGQPVLWEKADGSKVKLTYDEKGNLSSITNSAGGCTRYEYNSRNHVVKTIDGLGNETSYGYNDADELVWVKDAAGNVQSYVYDECGNVVRMTDVSGAETITKYNAMNLPEQVIRPDGSSMLYEYDAMWNIACVTNPDGGKTTYRYDQNQNLVCVEDPDGGTNQMQYDPCGNMIRREDPDGGIYQLGYDELNRPNYVCDPAGVKRSAKYDELGNVTEILYPDGRTERFTYDRMSRVTMSEDRAGYQRFYEYDILGNLKTISDLDGVLEEYTYYPGGLLESEQLVDGSKRIFYYDCNENVVRIVNQDGNEWNFTYDCLGRVTAAVQDQGIAESYEYDALGNITAVIDGNGVKTSYSYHGSDIASVIDGLGNGTYFSYDHCGRMVRMVQCGKGQIDAAEINRFNRNQQELRITDYHYDQKGNIIESIDPDGNRVFYTYDGNNRILSRTDEDGGRTCCEYNPDGTIRSYHFADGKDVKMSYNPLKQLIQMEDWLGITHIEPDGMGRPKQVIAPDGERTAYEWGICGEQKAIVYPDGTAVSYEYDEARRLSKCSFGKDTVSYGYYPGGKLKEKIMPDQARILYQYNGAGHISEICHLRSGEKVDRLQYRYDANGRKSQILRERSGMEDHGIYEYQYNAVGSLIAVLKNGKEEERYEYDAFGNRIFSDIGGSRAEYTYNCLDQLVNMEDMNGKHTYSYDHMGNMIAEQLNGVQVKNLIFNAQGLLENVKQAGRTVAYQYNGFGDRIGRSVTDGTKILEEQKYLYDISKPFNHLLGIKERGSYTNVIWDGGILASADEKKSQYYINDERMSPLRIIRDGKIAASMSYDSFGNQSEGTGTGAEVFGYAGYRPDPVSGFSYVNAREYDAKKGRFISRDLIPGMITLPLTLNAYSYALGDPVNRYDPTGMVVAWLAAGIVGTVVNVVTKIAGDVVESVATGDVHVSSWQSYVGTAAGGFTYGTTLVATGGNIKIAGAASGAVETFATEGLSMLTGAEGYRAEDGYSWKNLAANTITSGVSGAATGYIFGQAGKFVKIPGINKGRGSFQAVWKQVMTKAQKGLIHDISWKTIGKGLVAYGGIHLLDEIWQKGKKKIKDLIGDKVIDGIRSALGGDHRSAACTTGG